MSQELEETPFVIWPESDEEHKFVQLELDSRPFLRFQTPKASIHASIIWNFLAELKIDYKSIKGCLGLSCPALEGERYKVFGMGKANIDLERKRVSFYGSSRDYGIGTSREFFERHGVLIPDWTLRY